MVKRTITFTCPRCHRTYMNATSETECDYCKDYDYSQHLECFKPVCGHPKLCDNRTLCFQIFGENLRCNQNPKNQKVENSISLNQACYRKLEL